MTEFIGTLRARVALQAPQRTSDDLGGASIAWADMGEVWADIEPGGGGAGADFDGAVSRVSYRLTIRAQSDVRAGWRVLWEGRALSIETVSIPDAARFELGCVEESL